MTERKRFSWLSLAAADEFAADSHTFSLRPPPPVDQVEEFFASLAWTTRTEWVGVDYDIEPTTELIVHPSVRNGDDIGVVLRGEGWRCTRNGGCGYEDLAGLRMRPTVVEIVDLEATVAKLSTAGAA
ncbi:hypothetical protein [Rhodococcus sp. BS-15]|uniref:hypothetical protein n=1 Tax=Rhodococcus sp. BS-15 TaxID=1304954 RepID=UPI000AE382A0|nr:hypothetical protein [Rhodococcus sp. BS-15]